MRSTLQAMRVMRMRRSRQMDTGKGGTPLPDLTIPPAALA
ncbi:hypothetical protein QO005_000373 [Rhizobium paknamense]|uniref:Uncharacterized protein n=1 Tax=Rhizobium paknamense TaxID=1206817 RepID=A0ABU0I8X4_9HYPH|nr:hypothetical protein [Rhizobium paknamense]